MNNDVKALWVEALRSGEYTQTTDVLRRRDSMCCLGVLCDLHHKTTNDGEWTFSRDGVAHYITKQEKATTDLPRIVQAWAGLDEYEPFIGERSITAHNDGRGDIAAKSFLEIADLIEKHL